MEKPGFVAVIQHLESSGDYDRGFHLSSSAGSRYYIPAYLDAEELPGWFGEEVAALLRKLKPGEGVHCRLMPQAVGEPLSKDEIEGIAEHDASRTLTLEELRSR